MTEPKRREHLANLAAFLAFLVMLVTFTYALVSSL